MKKFSIFSLTLLTIIFGLNFKAYAVGEFQTEYLVNYAISEDGETQVTYDVAIINSQSDVVATKYSLSLKQVSVYDVLASDQGGVTKVTTEVVDDTSTITASLNEQAIGQNKKNNLKIAFKTKNIAMKIGEVWNINIPRIQSLDSTNKYDVTLEIPASFGPTIFVSPITKEEIGLNGKKTYKFTKNDLIDKGITASFGKYQFLSYQLKYQLANTSSFNSTQEIALPPDITDKQKVFYKNLTPAPISVKSDEDGNVLAVYRLKAKENLEITLTGSARIMGKQIAPEFGGKMEKLPNDLVRKFTKQQKYWETGAKDIQAISKTLYKKENTVSQNAYEVYNFVVQNLEYDFEAAKNPVIERKGAEAILIQKNKAACMEFTDLFIALTRAMGIPARELNGYALGNTDTATPISINMKSGDLLHSWPEFYDPNFGWVAVDPTWGNTSKMDYFTKLDTNHFVFSVKGMSSEYPLPAGVYRTDEQAKLIEIGFAYEDTASGFKDVGALEQAGKFVVKEKVSLLTIAGIFGGIAILMGLIYFFVFRKKNTKIRKIV